MNSTTVPWVVIPLLVRHPQVAGGSKARPSGPVQAAARGRQGDGRRGGAVEVSWAGVNSTTVLLLVRHPQVARGVEGQAPWFARLPLEAERLQPA